MVAVDVLVEPLAERVEDRAGASAVDALVVDDDVGGQHGHAARDGPGVQVVDVDDAEDLLDLVADLVEVDALGWPRAGRR